MSLQLDIAWLLATGLLSVRIAAATALAPVLGPSQIPGSVRVILAFVLGAAMVSASPAPAATSLESPWSLAAAVSRELLIGGSFSLGFLAAYAATQFAGRALDIQMGFGIAAAFNPAVQDFSPLLGTVFGLASLMVFLALDGHHVLIQALALSAQNAPPGYAPYSPDWQAVVAQSGVMFTFGAALAGPVMLALLLADLSMAVLARSMPLLNVFVLSFAVKTMVGLMALAATTQLAEPLLAALYGTTFSYWRQAAEAP
jgi:flagellar biosynthesis protein FliR